MRPNLIFVFADQLRYDACGFSGNRLARTPAIDLLARQGLSFNQAVSTSPVCTAYRASLFTGKYTTSTGMVINELRMNPNQRCLGHILADEGYDTCYIGKWHLYANELGNHDDPRNSFIPRGPHRLGFDGEWCAYNFHHDNYGPRSYYHRESPEKLSYGDGVYEADGQTDLAIDYLRRHSQGEEPFAMILSWGPPHDPWSAENTPADLVRLFDPADFSHPVNYLPTNDPYGDAWSRLGEADRADLPSWRAHYAAQVSSIDRNLGRLTETLDELGLTHDTLLVFTSDHGEMFGAHGRRAKNIFYEEACRVPLLFRWPGKVPENVISSTCIGTVDLMPTLLGLLGIEPPHDVEGQDFSNVALSGIDPPPNAALMMICGATADWCDGHEWRALRDAGQTYAVYRRDGAELLFDNIADPFQMKNVIAEPRYESIASRMRDELQSRMAKIGDEFQACTWYRDHWTDGERRIIRSETCDWADLPLL